jgi:hypothetical protein
LRETFRHSPQRARHLRGRDDGAADLLRAASVDLRATRGVDSGGAERLIRALQSGFGNAAVQRALDLREMQPIQVVRRPTHASAPGGSFSVHGVTDATFDGGTGKMVNQKVAKSKACEDCAEGECVRVTGTLSVTYHVDVVVTMPDVPDGLNACEEAKVRQFINTTLQAHENEHVRRFKTYNGTKAIPINLTGCGQSDVQSQVQALHDADEQTRQSNAQALSDAIDPFTRSIDLSKCPS